MTTIINQYKGYGVNHTISKIQEYQKGFDEEGFTQYQEGKKTDYRLLSKYLEQQHKGVKATIGNYGIELTINKGEMTGVVVLSYCQDELIFMHQNNAMNKYIERAITEFNKYDWMVEVTDKQINELIELHFNLSNYIKKYKNAMWVTLMVKVVEEYDFYEEFIQGMDKFSKLELMWNYTSNGLTVYHEDDSYQIDDSHIILQEDRLTVLEGFFQYINYIKSKYYQVEATDEDDVKDTVDEQGTPNNETLTLAEAFDGLEDSSSQKEGNDIEGNEEQDSGDGELVVSIYEVGVISDECIVEDDQERLLTEQVLDDLQTQQEEEYLNNLKKGKVPEFQSIKINEEGSYMHPIQATSYLTKLKADLTTAIIVYKDGKEIVNTLNSMNWAKRSRGYIDSVIDGVEQVIKKYGLVKVDLVFNKDYKDVQVRIDRGDKVDEIWVVCSTERHKELVKQGDEVINVGVGNPTSIITGWFQTQTGW